jgi:hypothetical protein
VSERLWEIVEVNPCCLDVLRRLCVLCICAGDVLLLSLDLGLEVGLEIGRTVIEVDEGVVRLGGRPLCGAAQSERFGLQGCDLILVLLCCRNSGKFGGPLLKNSR